MNSRTLFILAVILLSVSPLAYYAGLVVGEANSYRAIRKETLGNLKIASEKGDGMLYEYLKARYYYYSNRARIQLRSGEGDYGNVDSKLLEGYYAGKDLVTFESEYENYKKIEGFSE